MVQSASEVNFSHSGTRDRSLSPGKTPHTPSRLQLTWSLLGLLGSKFGNGVPGGGSGGADMLAVAQLNRSMSEDPACRRSWAILVLHHCSRALLSMRRRGSSATYVHGTRVSQRQKRGRGRGSGNVNVPRQASTVWRISLSTPPYLLSSRISAHHVHQGIPSIRGTGLSVRRE